MSAIRSLRGPYETSPRHIRDHARPGGLSSGNQRVGIPFHQVKTHNHPGELKMEKFTYSSQCSYRIPASKLFPGWTQAVESAFRCPSCGYTYNRDLEHG